MARTPTRQPHPRAKQTKRRPASPTRPQPWERQRDALLAAAIKAPPAGIAPEEIATHFAHMPARYWTRVDQASVRWHLGTIHAFLAHLAHPASSGTSPVVRWRHFPARGFTEIAICTWDRLGLVSKAAAALADTGLNIIRAEIYTRSDHLVLDLFQVSGLNQRPIKNEAVLERVAQSLDAALSIPAILAASPPRPGRRPRRSSAPRAATHPVVVTFDNDRSTDSTILEIEAGDRVGLLHAIFQVLADCEVNVAQAIITTEADQVGDVFYLTDARGQKIHNPARLETIRSHLLAVL